MLGEGANSCRGLFVCTNLFSVCLAGIFVLTLPSVPCVPFALLSRKVTSFYCHMTIHKSSLSEFKVHSRLQLVDYSVFFYQGTPALYCIIFLHNKTVFANMKAAMVTFLDVAS